MTNQQDPKMRFNLLLQHLDLTDDVHMPYFEAAELTRMTVHKKERTWRFMIKVKQTLPLKLYLLLKERLYANFSSIATVQLQIESSAASADENLIMEYWKYVVEEFSDMAPPLREQLIKQAPEWNGQKLMVKCSLSRPAALYGGAAAMNAGCAARGRNNRYAMKTPA